MAMDQHVLQLIQSVEQGNSNSSGYSDFLKFTDLTEAIRHQLEYANHPRVIALCHDSSHPQHAALCRARNARLIMSNTVPEIDITLHPEYIPYCIWYPDVAKEDTYRQLAQQYPCMRYQVGRACAVAGYTSLYRDLDLLPEVSIADEARESPKGKAIFGDIMSKPTRYSVMNDYERTVRDSPAPNAVLNGDTCVLAYLNSHNRTVERYFDITENGGRIKQLTGEEDDGGSKGPLASCANDVFGPENAWLLYSPLPKDLPPINKDLLILTAAYEGNVDRYARLRRPKMISLEHSCIIRGAYHSTPFAKWWTTLPECTEEILAAARARFVMINDLSWLHVGEEKRTLPGYMIWWPVTPNEMTLRILWQHEPRTKQQVAHAAIHCNYQRLYDEIRPVPNATLMSEASGSHVSYYRLDLESRASNKQQLRTGRGEGEPHLAYDTTYLGLHNMMTALNSTIAPSTMDGDYEGGFYGDWLLDGTQIDLFTASTVEFLKKVKKRGSVEDATWYGANMKDDSIWEVEGGDEEATD